MTRVGLRGGRDGDDVVWSGLLAALSSGAHCRMSSFILGAWGCLFCPCRCWVFLVFLDLVSFSGYSSTSALLPERFDPSGSTSSYVRSQSTMSCCWSSSWDGGPWFLVLLSGIGCICADVLAPAAAARAAARVEGPVPASCVLGFLVSRWALFAASAALAFAAAFSFVASVSAAAAIAAASAADAAFAASTRFAAA